MEGYDHQKIERKWQEKWMKDQIFSAKDIEAGKENEYLLVEFPYPSGDLHVGHWYAFAVTDIYVKYARMLGRNVLFPIGFDAFGLPAENAAIKRGLNPKDWTYQNIEFMRKQLQSMGASFDWNREVITCNPEYYKWTQWLFLEFFKKGLVYQKEAPVNWCPSCKTVLANEQVVSGECERCGTEVEQKNMRQWFMKITDYADRLIDDLENLNWPKAIKESQKAWIGRSEGSIIPFKIKNPEITFEVFTTRADTLFGVTYIVFAPENELVQKLLDHVSNRQEVEKYISDTSKRTEMDRISDNKEKTGVKLEGIVAINPANQEEIPIFIADYVLSNYGTGVVMAVPAHDERDYEFAKKFNLSIKTVVIPEFGQPNKDGVYRRVGIAIAENESGEILIQSKTIDGKTFYGLPGGGIEEGESAEEGTLRELIEETGYYDVSDIRELGTIKAHYFNPARKVYREALVTGFFVKINTGKQNKPNLTDDEKKYEINHNWVAKEEARNLLEGEQKAAVGDAEIFKYLFSEQIYFNDGVLIHSGEFDNLSSTEAKIKITEAVGGRLAKNYRLRDWLISRQRYWGCPIPLIHCAKCGIVPEENLPVILPEISDYLPSGDGKSPLAKVDSWKNVKCPKCGGDAERETDTLDTFIDSSWYYLRFLDPHNSEEFANSASIKAWMPVRFYSGGAEHNTMHLLFARFFHKVLFDLGLVFETEPFAERLSRGIILGPDGNKMSKSKGNVVDPDRLVESVGSDTVRMYLAFLGPYNEPGHYPWDPNGVVGIRRFLERVVRTSQNLAEATDELVNKELHKTIKGVSEDINKLKLNTAISKLMVFLNNLEKKNISKEDFNRFIRILAPFAPHLAEELWNQLGNNNSIHKSLWPEYDEKLTIEEKIQIAVQINGKVRAQIQIPNNAEESEVRDIALSDPLVTKWLENMEITKTVYVKNRIINFIV